MRILFLLLLGTLAQASTPTEELRYFFLKPDSPQIWIAVERVHYRNVIVKIEMPTEYCDSTFEGVQFIGEPVTILKTCSFAGKDLGNGTRSLKRQERRSAQ